MISPETLLERCGPDPEEGAAPTPEQAEALISAATAYLERRTGWALGETQGRVDYITGDGSSRLWLRGYPADPDYVSVTEATHPGGDEVDVEDYVIRGPALVRRCWWPGYEYVVTYSAGWELDTGPADLREVVAQLAMWLWNEQQVTGQDGGVREERIGDYGYKLGASGDERLEDDLPMLAHVVQHWRRMPI
jgi:hypothetical protein